MSHPAATLIDELGGRRTIADATGFTVGSIDLWRHRNRIPRTAWPELQQAFPTTATLEALLETERAAPADEAAPAEARP